MRRSSLLALLLVTLTVLAAVPGHAAIEDLEFNDPRQRERYEQLIEQLRCPMCLNTNLAGSDAPIAQDLRAEIYEQIQAGRSNREIIDFMTQRYGDFINYRPPLNAGTLVLWFGPLILLLLGFIIVVRMGRASGRREDVELSPEEQAKLESLLSSKADK